MIGRPAKNFAPLVFIAIILSKILQTKPDIRTLNVAALQINLHDNRKIEPRKSKREMFYSAGGQGRN